MRKGVSSVSEVYVDISVGRSENSSTIRTDSPSPYVVRAVKVKLSESTHGPKYANVTPSGLSTTGTRQTFKLGRVQVTLTYVKQN